MPKMNAAEIKAMAQSNGYAGNDIDDFSVAVENLQTKTTINANWFLALFYAESYLKPNIVGGYQNLYKGLFQVGRSACTTINNVGGSSSCNYDTFQSLPGARQVELYYWFLVGHGLLGKITNPADAHLGNVLPAVISKNFSPTEAITYTGYNKQADWMYPDGNRNLLTRDRARIGFLNTFGTRFNLLNEMGAGYDPNLSQQQQAQEQGIAQGEEEKKLVKYVDLNPFLKEIDSNIKDQEKGYIKTTWGKIGDRNWVGFKQYIMFLAHSFMPHGIVPFLELIPNYQMSKSNLNKAQEDLKSNADKIVDEVMQNRVGSFTDEDVLQAKRQFQQIFEKIPGYDETRYNNMVKHFNKLSHKADMFTLDPWKQEFDKLGTINEIGLKSWKKKNVGLRVYGQIVLSPEAESFELSKAGEIGFESVTINMGSTTTKGLSLIEFKLKDVQGNKFTDINSPWSFLFDARPGTTTADFLFRYGWSIKVPKKDKNNTLSNLFWEHDGWKLFPESFKIKFHDESIKNNHYFLLTQSLDFRDFLWDKKEDDNKLGIDSDESEAYMQLSLLNPKIEIDSSGAATATIQFRTGAGLTKNCPANLAYTCQNIVSLYPGGVSLADLIIAVKTDLDNNSAMVDEPALAKKKEEENISKSKALTNGTKDLTGIAKVIGAIDYGANNDDQSINPDSVKILFPEALVARMSAPQSTDTVWSWFADLLSANDCTLLNFMNGSGLLMNEDFVITTTQPNAQPMDKTKQKIEPTQLKDMLKQDKDIFAYKHQSSLIENISFQTNDKPNQFTIALNYRLGEWLNYNNMSYASTEDNEDQANKVNVLDRKTNIINMFSQTMEVSIDCICQPWITNGLKFNLKGTGFNDGNYSCLEVTHTLDNTNKFSTNIKAIRIIPPGDQDLEKSLSSPEIYDTKRTSEASNYNENENSVPYLNKGNAWSVQDKLNSYKLPYQDGKLLKPAKGPITSAFGARSKITNQSSTYHEAVDIGCAIGTNIIAPESGTISTNYSDRGGNQMFIHHDNGMVSGFAHLSKYLKKNGDRVNKGELVALSGNTGDTSGPHLHYTLKVNDKKVNPENYWA